MHTGRPPNHFLLRAGAKRGYDDGGHDTTKRARYDDDAALGPDGKRLHTDTSAAIIGSETVYRLLVPAKKVCSHASAQQFPQQIYAYARR